MGKKLGLREAKNKIYSTAAHMAIVNRLCELTGDKEFAKKIAPLTEQAIDSLAALLDALPWELEFPFDIENHPEIKICNNMDEVAAIVLGSPNVTVGEGGNA